PAGVAIAAGLDRDLCQLELLVAQFERAGVSEGRGVTAVACGEHAVEEVDSARYSPDDVERPADAHQVARPIGRQRRSEPLEKGEHFIGRFADGEAADGVSREIERAERIEALPPKIEVEPALHNSKERLIGALVGAL